jgi:hypothetical protein
MVGEIVSDQSRDGDIRMQAKDPVGQFVRDALLAERSRAEIRKALEQAGWSGSEINEALAQYAEIEFTPPIPVPRPQLTARDVFIYAVLFTALTYTSIYLIVLVHALLDLWIPDPGDLSYLEIRATRQARWAIATLVISAPVYLWVSRYVRNRVQKDARSRRSPVRKYLTYLALFVSAMAFLGDATYLIHGFLEGAATLRFVLKAATVGVVTLAVFLFYLRDVEYLGDEQ